MTVKIQVRNGTAAQWTSANPTLSAGELGAETDTGKIKVGTGAAAWTALPYASGTGTVSTVGWTGGIVSIANPTSTPAFTIAGTSGGIPYFNSGTTWATSAALGANALVVGGGAGAAPATISNITSDNSYLQLGATTPLRFGNTGNTFYVALKGPASTAANVTWTLPATDGTSGQLLSTNGSGTLSWATASGGGGAVASGSIYLNSLTISSSYTITTGQGAHSVGPITVASGAVLTVASGSRYVIA